MTFDWIAFLNLHGVEYVERGSNVSKGYVNINCPWCGAADPSHHMGVPAFTDGPWGCWRNKEHRGRSPVRLVQRLAGCSWTEARDIVGLPGEQPVSVDLAALRSRLDGHAATPIVRPVMPSEFFPLAGQPRTTAKQRMLNYLEDRGFELPVRLAKQYDLRGCMVDRFAWRVIVPLYLRTELVGWTARAIVDAKARYLTEGETRDILFEGPRVEEGGRALIICEGPFDALKLDYYGREHKVRAVALLGLDPSSGRLARCAQLGARFDRVLVALDRGAEAQALALRALLASLRPGGLPLPPAGEPGAWVDPERAKDPGDLSRVGVESVIQAALTSEPATS